MKILKRCVWLLIFVTTVACGGSSNDDSPKPEPDSEDQPATAAGGAVNTLADVNKAVIKVVGAIGVHDPATAIINEASGFIIGSSGLAVTNSVIVTSSDAGSIKVFLNGDNMPRDITVLGVADCSNIAVIDIDGDNYDYLQWTKGDILENQEIFATGFPKESYAIVKHAGVILENDIAGHTQWTSVNTLLEHDAFFFIGCAGGPLVDANGRVIGVNTGFAFTSQPYAISRDDAVAAVEIVENGRNKPLMGISGEVFMGDDLESIWVYAVALGSPADIAGVKVDDMVLSLGGQSLVENSSLDLFCFMTESFSAGDVLDIEVMRYDLQIQNYIFLKGQINGNELEIVSTPQTFLNKDTPTELVTIRDETGELQLQAPAAWDDIRSYGWEFEGERTIGPMVVASVDSGSFMESLNIEGVAFAKSERLPEFGITDAAGLLDYYMPAIENRCEHFRRERLDTLLYSGDSVLALECEGSDLDIYVMTGTSDIDDFLFYAKIQTRQTEDLAADIDLLNRIIEGLMVIPVSD